MREKFLAETKLFEGVDPESIKAMLQCLGAASRTYKKDEYVYMAGDLASAMGLILKGAVNVEHDDIWGKKTILNHVTEGEIFAEAYACIPGEAMMISVITTEDTEILWMDVNKVLKTCSLSCEHHNRLIQNLLLVLARKNLYLSRRILHTSSKSIRERLLSYLSFQAKVQESREIVIPFNRQQLADYLGLNRSALSNEISKMQKDGIISVKKNRFILHNEE